MSSFKKIILVGMPGSGKTTVGRLLAEELRLEFYDLDSEIESRQAKTINEIFASGGEGLFRSIETNILQDIIAKKSALVLASGGGTPCFYTNMQEMNEVGITIFLNTPVDLLIARTKQNYDRPLLRDNHSEKVKELLLKRTNCYKQARHQLKTADQEPGEIMERIIVLLAGI